MSNPLMKINGTALPDPSYKTYSAVRKELVNAARTVNGDLTIHRLASKGKYTVTAEWTALTAAEKNSLLKLTGGYSNDDMSFSLTFFSTMDDVRYTRTFYRGDMSEGDVIGYGHYFGGQFQYYDVKLTFIEL